MHALGESIACLPVLLQDFYEDVFEEMAQYGEIENLNVCDNVADHMVGSVYIKFIDEGAAALALQGLQVRPFSSHPFLLFWQHAEGCHTGGTHPCCASPLFCSVWQCSQTVLLYPPGPLLRGAPHQHRVLARHGLSGGDVPPVRGEHVHAGRLLQLHAPAPHLAGPAQAAVRPLQAARGRRAGRQVWRVCVTKMYSTAIGLEWPYSSVAVRLACTVAIARSAVRSTPGGSVISCVHDAKQGSWPGCGPQRGRRRRAAGLQRPRAAERPVGRARAAGVVRRTPRQDRLLEQGQRLPAAGHRSIA
jgi:hypothetical protein